MIRRRFVLPMGFALCAAITARAGEDAAPTLPASGDRLEVAFVLDTTGSMNGLIQGAKDKIWSIAQDIVRDFPNADLRFALVGYRDRGDQYVTKKTDLTNDLDAVNLDLRAFSADGGNDHPESVNEALRVALRDLAWTKGDAGADVYKVVFLVGDAPPHMDYDDEEGVRYPELCAEARKADIVVNAIQCGRHPDTEKIWREIARLADGEYIGLAQDGRVETVATPFDAELAAAAVELAKTALPYGSATTRGMLATKMAGLGSIGGEAAAARASVVNDELSVKHLADPVSAEALTAPIAISGGVMLSIAPGDVGLADDAEGEEKAKTYNFYARQRAFTGAGDLVADIAEGKVKLDAVKEEELPEDLKKIDAGARAQAVAERLTQRAILNEKIATLTKRRDEHLATLRSEAAAKAEAALAAMPAAERAAAAASMDSFDESVRRTVNAQAAARKK